MPFWPFMKRIRVEPLAPEELQSRLVQAAYTSRRYLKRFCRAYREQIEANVDSLITVPPGLVARVGEVGRFIRGLGIAAQCLATECGSPALGQALTGTPENNPILRWQQLLEALPERTQRLEHEQLRDELVGLIEEIKGFHSFRGNHARQQEAISQGWLGWICFHGGRGSEAAAPTQLALEVCRRIDDREGATIYLNNLVDMARYAGDTAAAIHWAEQLYDELLQQGRKPEAADAARQLERLRAGDPLCRLVCRQGDQVFELDEVRPVEDGTRQFEFVRNRPRLQKACELTRQGKEKGSRYELTDALDLFQQAAEVDPHDPDPWYQCGVALMDLGAFGQAKEAFAETERLAPGWFNCRRDGWLAERLELGELPSDVWTIVRGLEDGGLSPRDLLTHARDATQHFPEFAPFWLMLGNCLLNDSRQTAAVDAYRRGLACVQEPQTESELLCTLAMNLPADDPERQELIQRTLAIPGSLLAQAAVRLLLAFPA